MSGVDVTVIIPTFNRLWSLPRAVDSCRGTVCRTQIIVVDDGSIDGSHLWLASQPDLLVITQSNQGQTWAANRALPLAAGAYVRFLDSDDLLLPGAIDRQLAVARATGAGVVYSRVDELLLPSGAVRRGEVPDHYSDFLATQLGEPGQGHYLGMLFHRDIALAVPRRPDFALRDDRMFLLEVALREPLVRYAEGCAGHWVKHPTQMHDSYRGLTGAVATWQHIRIYRQVLGEMARRGMVTDRRRRAAAATLLGLAHEAARWDLETGIAVADWAYGLDPDLRGRAGALDRAYRLFGFGATERLLRIRRVLRGLVSRSPSRADWYALPPAASASARADDAGPVQPAVVHG